MKLFFAIFAGLILVTTASADTVWAYTGNTMKGCNCALTGTVTVGSKGQIKAWDFSDGTHELTQANSVGTIFDLSSPLGGAPFSEWFVALTTSPFGLVDISTGLSFVTEFYGSNFEATDGSFVGINAFGFLEGNKGSWSDPAIASEPSTGLLIGLTLACAGLLRRGKRKLPESTVWEKLG